MTRLLLPLLLTAWWKASSVSLFSYSVMRKGVGGTSKTGYQGTMKKAYTCRKDISICDPLLYMPIAR